VAEKLAAVRADMEALKTDALIVSALDEVLHFFVFATALCYCTALRFLNFTTVPEFYHCI
jgi:hypothetical protein